MGHGLYSRDILRLASSIPHHRRLSQPDASAERRSPVCGSRVTVDIRLDPEGRVSEIGQDVRACALGQASAALMAGNALGRSADELVSARDLLVAYLAGERPDPGAWPGLDVLSAARDVPARHAAILLPFEAAADALRQAEVSAE